MWGVGNPRIVLPKHIAPPRVLWLIAKGFTSFNSCGRSHMWQVVKTSHDPNTRQGQIAPFFFGMVSLSPLGIHHGPKRYIVSHTLFPCFHVNRIAGPCYQSDRPFSFRWMEWRWPLLDFLGFGVRCPPGRQWGVAPPRQWPENWGIFEMQPYL